MSAGAVARAVDILIRLKVKLSDTAYQLLSYLCSQRLFSKQEISILFGKVYPNIEKDIIWAQLRANYTEKNQVSAKQSLLRLIKA